MRLLRWAACLILFVNGADANAQWWGPGFPGPPVGFRQGYHHQIGIGPYGQPFANFQSFSYQWAYPSPWAISPWGYGYSPWMGGPFFNPFVPNTIIIQQPPPIVVQPVVIPVVIPAGGVPDRVGGFPFDVPQNPMPKLLPPPKPKVEVPRKLVEPELKLPKPIDRPRDPPPLPRQAEADQLNEAGRTAFAEGKFGKAVEVFQKLCKLAPDDPSSFYLLSQGQFALGKYHLAVESIRRGMELRKDWADARYAPRALYGKNDARFDEHLKQLRQAIEMFPGDAQLMFLLGHQLWFDNQRDEAAQKLRKAGDQIPGQEFMNRAAP